MKAVRCWSVTVGRLVGLVVLHDEVQQIDTCYDAEDVRFRLSVGLILIYWSREEAQVLLVREPATRKTMVLQ